MISEAWNRLRKETVRMNEKNTRIALIPAYMPGAALIPLVRELCENELTVVVINDGSGEDYKGIFESLSFYATVLEHKVNKGKGAAIKTGIAYIGANFDPPYTVVTLDADGQHSVEDALKVSAQAELHRQSLILGCREFKGENVKVPKKSMLGNKITRAVFRLSSGLYVSDTQTGLRAFSDRHIVRLLEISGERYEYEMNMLMEYAREEIPIEEVGIETIYIDGNSSSHFDPLHDSARIYKEILKFSASSLVSFFLDYGLFCLFSAVTGSVILSNVTARIFSATANFEMNRRLVFKSKKSALKSGAEYFTLAVFILIFNTLLLDLLVTATPLGKYAAKLITECAMFVVNWAVQRTVIFKRKDAEAK